MPRRCEVLLHRVQGVGENRLGVVQQAADQRALAVVDAAAGEKAQQAVVDFGQVFQGGHMFSIRRLHQK